MPSAHWRPVNSDQDDRRHSDRERESGVEELCVLFTFIFPLQNPKVFVDTVIQVQQKNFNLAQNAFAMDSAFRTALDRGCERFINKNAVTDLAGSARKSPELLAKYIDMLLKKG